MKAHRSTPTRFLLAASILIGAVGCSGCNPEGTTTVAPKGGGGDGGGEVAEKQFVTLGTAPVGGAFRPIGDALASVLEENRGDNNWEVQSKGTRGSQQNIHELDSGDIRLGMSNSAISFHAVNGTGVWDKEFEIRTVMTLAPNIGVFISKADSGIETIADLRGKRVSVGPAGAGFEMFLGPLLSEHGLTYDDFTPVNQIYSDSVGLLGDGNIDAAFMGGAVPLPALTQACTSHDIRFLAYDDAIRSGLIDDTEKYPFFQEGEIPATNVDGKPTYRGLTANVSALDVGSMHLITTIDEDEELIYQVTKTLWEQREEIGNRHAGAGKSISENNAARFTGTPFHDGAIRFYKEIGIWDDGSGDKAE
jgi:TRAP transporter TAXI family solute receptor